MTTKKGWKEPIWRQCKSRYYADVLNDFPDSFSNPDTLTIETNLPYHYELTKKMGHGKFGEVFEGMNTKINKTVAVKILKPVKKKKIQREVKILKSLEGGPNIVQLLDIVRDPESKTYSFIFEEVENDDFKILYPKLQLFEVKFYLFQILKALDFSHSRGIMHRDIKPHNVMIDHKRHKLRVIDWGLAEYYHPLMEYNVRVASRHYKGPELLVGLKCYDYSLDMWSFGCILASFLFRKIPFFRGKSDEDQLVKITQVLGTDELVRYINRYELDQSILQETSASSAAGGSNPSPSSSSSALPAAGGGKTSSSTRSHGNQNQNPLLHCPRKAWSSFMTTACEPLVSETALALLDGLLRFDHLERLSAKEAMNHPWFEEVRRFRSSAGGGAGGGGGGGGDKEGEALSCGIDLEEDDPDYVPPPSELFDGAPSSSHSTSPFSSSSSTSASASVSTSGISSLPSAQGVGERPPPVMRDFLDWERYRLSQQTFVPLMSLIGKDGEDD